MRELKFISNIDVPVLIYIFLFFIPLSLISGPFIPDLLTSIISILVIFFCLKKRNIIYFSNKYFILFLILYSILLVSSSLSTNIIFSLSSSLFYFRFFLLSIGIWIVLEKLNSKYLLLSITLPFIFLFVDSTFQYFYGYNILGFPIAEQYRISSFFGDELKMGSYISRFLPILLCLVFVYIGIGKINNVLIFLIILPSFILVLLSGERSALGMTTLIIFLLIVYISKYSKNYYYIFFFLIIIVITFFSLDPELFKRFVTRTIVQLNIFNYISGEGNMHIITWHHEGLFKTAYNIFLDNFLLGIGPKMFRVECAYYIECSTHPHNYYLQFLSEIGIIGFSFFVIMYIIILYNLINLFKKSKVYYFQFFGSLSLAVQLLPIFPTGNFFNNWLSILMFYSLGLYFYGKKNNL